MQNAFQQSINQLTRDAWNDVFMMKGRGVPPHLDQLIELGRLENEGKNNIADYVRLGWNTPADIFELEEEIEFDMEERAHRRGIELCLSLKLEEDADVNHPDMWVAASKMQSCRQQGVVGKVPGRDGYQVAWAHKCGLSKLCPDESREEGRRLENKYSDPIEQFAISSPLHSVQYGVFTLHNFRPGDLARGKQYIFEKLKPLREKFPQIKGLLLSQEDPLGKQGDWNIHINALMLVQGNLSWKEVREWWGFNVHFDLVEKEKIGYSIRELIKYAVKHVTAKEGDAPGLLDWNAREFREWFNAQKKFRRTRAYGCLYAIHGKRWHSKDSDDFDRRSMRREWVAQAATRGHILEPSILDADWKQMDPFQKNAIRKAMDEGESFAAQVEWLGAVKFVAYGRRLSEGVAGVYQVDLIPGDNFFSVLGKTDNFSNGPPGPLH